MKPPPQSTGNGIGSITPEQWLTRSKAAHKVQRSVDTLKRWQRSGLCVPSGKMKVGTLEVWLYSETDIERLLELARTQKPGRKTKEV